MNVTLLAFHTLKQKLGFSECRLDVEAGVTPRRLLKNLLQIDPDRTVRYAINQEYVSGNEELHEGDEVAFIPPVSGG